MKTAQPLRMAAIAALLLSFTLQPTDAGAMCCPFPCDDCFITSRGELNLIVMNRDIGEVRMIPNLRFTGTAEEFAIIVPTPKVPRLTPGTGVIWNQAALLTAAVSQPRSFGGSSGCGTSASAPEVAGRAEDDVNVIRTESVGAFIATIVRSENPAALVEWLNVNGYNVDAAEAAAIRPFAERGWVFTAMKLDTTKPEAQVPIGGWDSNVDPVIFDFEGTDLEVPLSIIGINRGPDMPVVFYVLDDHRVTLTGFETTYANRISDSEFAEMESRYPNLAAQLEAGRFLTRIDRTFTLEEPMTGSLMLARASSDQEFRRYGSNFGSFSGDLLLLLAGPFAARFVTRRRKR